MTTLFHPQSPVFPAFLPALPFCIGFLHWLPALASCIASKHCLPGPHRFTKECILLDDPALVSSGCTLQMTTGLQKRFNMKSDGPNKENAAPHNGDEKIEPSFQDSVAGAPVNQPAQSIVKPTTKQLILREVKEVLAIVLYLAVSLSILETYKSLILLQQGINEFGHNYTVAIVEALALGKIVALAQNLPFLSALRSRALVWVILYQSIVMTIIVDLGGQLEDHIFPRSAKLLAESGDPFVLMVTHQLVSMMIFIVLFTVRGAEKALGRGTLKKLFFEPPGAKTASGA
jgi:hypothetical protein